MGGACDSSDTDGVVGGDEMMAGGGSNSLRLRVVMFELESGLQ